MGSNNFGLTAAKEEDIELDLGLSIGRSYKRTKENGLINDQQSFLQRSSSLKSQQQQEVDPKAKRKLQALRRQEAKRKREEKLMVTKRGLFCKNGEELSNGWVNVGGNVKRPVAGDGGFGVFNAVSCAGRVRGDSKLDAGSGGSPASISSAGSDRGRSPSLEVGISSDTKSNLSQSTFDQPQLNGSKDDVKKEHEYDASPQQTVPAVASEQTHQIKDTNPSNTTPSTPSGPNQEDILEERRDFPGKHVASVTNSVFGCNWEKGKPPKPQTQNHGTSSLPHMPCVSTTGNGPDGKTVNGFLYNYTKTQVSIMCVCHGASFSPAEFVQHAGGTDITHPLRHITMIPSAY